MRTDNSHVGLPDEPLVSTCMLSMDVSGKIRPAIRLR